MLLPILASLSILAPADEPKPTAAAYLVSSNTGALRRYASDGSYLGDLVPPNNGRLGGPQHMALHEGKVLVCGWFNDRVSVVDLQTGVVLEQWSAPGASKPAFLRLAPEAKELWVSFTASDRVVRFALDDGRVLGDLWEASLVAAPHGIDVLPDGSYLVTSSDDGVYRVQAPDRKQRVATIPLAGGRPLNCEPLKDGLTFAVTGFVGDPSLSLQSFRLDTGEVLGTFSATQGARGDGLLRTPAGELLAVFYTSGSVARYDLDGRFLDYLIAPGSGLTQANAILPLPPPGSGE